MERIKGGIVDPEYVLMAHPLFEDRQAVERYTWLASGHLSS